MEILFVYPTNPDQWQWITADKLFTKLNISYIIIDNMEIAKCEFETLRQTNNITFSDFLTKFIYLSDRISYTNDLKIITFNQKISPALLDIAIYIEQPNYKDTDVFQKWIDLYIYLAIQIENYKHHTKLDNFDFQQTHFAPI